MSLWMLRATLRRAPYRLLLAALGTALPVAVLAATLWNVDVAVRSMTPIALQPVQVEMRALAVNLDLDLQATAQGLRAVPGVSRVDRFAAADVVVGTARGTARVSARLFAVDPMYLTSHPWVRAEGDLSAGALLNQAAADAGLGSAPRISVALPGDNTPIVTLPVSGRVDLRRAYTWLQVPTGEVQGDLAVVPRSLVVSFDVFQRRLLPALKAALGATTPVLNPGLTDLPPVEVEEHIALDHGAYPRDPGRAVGWSAGVRRALERAAPGNVVVADDAAEQLTLAAADATNAKVLFLYLGIPGFLVAAALGLAAESALAAAHRREDGLLRLRGATERQLATIRLTQAATTSAVGAVLGLGAGVLAVSVVEGRPLWELVTPSRMLLSGALSLGAALGLAVVRLRQLVRAGRTVEIVDARALHAGDWQPTWRRHRLELAAVGVGLAVLGLDVVAGGLRPNQVEGTILALAFYVLLAPLLLWVGLGLLAVRGLLAALTRWARPERAGPLRSWASACLRWAARRPARAGTALVLAVLAIAFGTELLAFVTTYGAAKHADAAAAFGSNLRLTPTAETTLALPALSGPVATTPVRFVPVRAGTDRKTVLAVDPSTYGRAVTTPPLLLQGRGVEALRDRRAVLIAPEIASGFGIGVGDALPLVVFPDDQEKSRSITFHVAGVFRIVAPTSPVSEIVFSQAALPDFLLPQPESFLVRGEAPPGVLAQQLHAILGNTFKVQTLAQVQQGGQRSLTALDLRSLSILEEGSALLVATLGVGVLGAHLVLERRRELAVLVSQGASSAQALLGPALEGALVVLAGIAVGVPLGLGLAMLSVRVLTLFFTLPPPLLVTPTAQVAVFAGLVALAGVASLASALHIAGHRPVGMSLREP